MTTLTEEQKAEIRARADAATPGPWRCEWSDRDAHYRIIFNEQGNWLAEVFEDEGDEGEPFDAAFIARARTDIPSLLAHIAEQDAALEAAEKRAEEAEKSLDTIKRRLASPYAVYINMLRGEIARPSVDQLEHVYQGELTAERDSLRAEVERLREALEPFAKAARSMEEADFDMPDEDIIIEDGAYGHLSREELLTFGDFRRAAALTNEASDGQG